MSTFEVGFSEGGTLVQFSPLEKLVSAAHSGGGARGEIKLFSAAARRRMQKRIGALDGSIFEGALMVTLTYPGIERSGAKSKRDLLTLLKRLRRKFPKAAGIWRLEFQERGAIHFHCLLWGVDFIAYEWVAAAWFEVVGSNNPDHLAAGTRVERVRSRRGAASYICKYVSKEAAESQECEGIGRFWGMFGDWQEALAPVVNWIMSAGGVAKLWRVFDRMRLAAARSISNRRVRKEKVSAARRRRDHTLYSSFFFCEVSSILPLVGKLSV